MPWGLSKAIRTSRAIAKSWLLLLAWFPFEEEAKGYLQGLITTSDCPSSWLGFLAMDCTSAPGSQLAATGSPGKPSESSNGPADVLLEDKLCSYSNSWLALSRFSKSKD